MARPQRYPHRPLADLQPVPPWTSVWPGSIPAAILGDLPFAVGSVTLDIPESVVPRDATGILVFAWAILRGANPDAPYWHIASAAAGASANWFSLLIAGDPAGNGTVCNSQAFWLPAPADRSLVVTLNAHDLPSSTNEGKVEIHGFYRGIDPRRTSA